MVNEPVTGQRFGILVIFIGSVLTLWLVFGCELNTTSLPTMGAQWPLAGTAQTSAQERYATQSTVEMNAIQTHQANATILAVNYQNTVNAAQRLLDQQQQAAAAIGATATERAYQATATQQALFFERTVSTRQAAETVQAAVAALDATVTERAYQATATQQSLVFEATVIRLTAAARATVTAEQTQAEHQVEANRQAQALADWRNYGLPAGILVLLSGLTVLIVYILGQYARRSAILDSWDEPQDDARPAIPLETQAQLVPIPPSQPSVPGLRSMRSLRRLDQARRAGFLSGPLLDSLAATWQRMVKQELDKENRNKERIKREIHERNPGENKE